MSVPPDLRNARVTSIERPVRGGIGGSVVSRTTVFTPFPGDELNAVYEPTDRVVRLQDEQEVVLEAILYVERRHPDDRVIDVEEGDIVSWRDANGVDHADAEVRVKKLWTWPGGDEVEHWELGVTGA